MRDLEALLRARDICWIDLQAIPSGLQHQLYRLTEPDGKQWVVKVARVDRDLGDVFDPDRPHLDGLCAEQAALARIQRVAVPHPLRILSRDPPVGIQPYVPGESGQLLWDKGRLSEEGLRSLCQAMGYNLAAIHMVRRGDDPGSIPDVPGCDPATARLVHLDYHLGNVQVVRDIGRGGWKVNGTLDWVLCRWGPREMDFVEMSISVFHQIPGTREAFMIGYRQGGGLPLDRELENYWLRKEILRRLATGLGDRKLRARWESWAESLKSRGGRSASGD